MQLALIIFMSQKKNPHVIVMFFLFWICCKYSSQDQDSEFEDKDQYSSTLKLWELEAYILRHFPFAINECGNCL